MAVKKEKNNISPDLLKIYEQLISAIPSVERKGASMPYTSLNGHMFSFISPEGKMGLRLPPNEREEFIKIFKVQLFIGHGTVLKEYVTVPEKLLKDIKSLKKYFTISYDYVKGLKPKPTTKKRIN
ncbi:MAG TPA: hypothetical protein VFD56_11525 [Chitinophagaceae bacterium]|nr:hypothetical protein [Chitinophagaceae bacterium]